MKCDIIIPIWNQKDITKDCIESIVRNTKYPYRLILIDNASDSGTKAYLESVRENKTLDVTLIRNETNLGFVKAVNQGLKASSAPYVCIFNNDTVTTPGWLEEMIEFAETNKEVGIINPLCGGPPDIPGDEYAKLIARDNKGKYMEMNQCFFFSALIRREVIDKIGYLDETFGVGSYDDTDYSMRAGLAGYRCVCLHSACVYHIYNVSFIAMGNRDKVVAACEKEYFKKWPRHLRAGIAFSLNEGIKEEEIANLLKAMLYLAREWCWINLWIFGDKDANRKRIETISKKVKMPLHQNIKFNFLPGKGKNIQLLIRLIERSFGTKRRKKYDFVLVDNSGPVSFLRAFGFLHSTMLVPVNFKKDLSGDMAAILGKFRNKR